jgi:CheY-like chemotaxis protein
MGYDVEIAHSGRKGIELLKKDNNFKLVITDIRMPGMNGNEMAEYIRKSNLLKDVPIVAITGFDDDIDVESFNYLLRKPFKMKALIDVIKSSRISQVSCLKYE